MTTATLDSARGRPLAPSRNGAGFATTSIGSARRTVLQFFRTPQVLVMGTVQGAMFLIMFRYVFGGAISTGGALSYVDFLVPGFLATIVLWTGMSAASGVAEDAATGVHDRLRSLPIPRVAVVVGRACADTALTAWGLLVTGLLSFAIGFRVHAPVADVVAGFALIVVAGFAFAWVFILIGLIGGNAQAAQGLSMLVIPFSFVSSANVPVASMPDWLQPFAANQPVSVLINAVRCLMQGGAERVGIGHSTGYWIVLTLIWCAGITLVFGALASRRFAKTR
ncbi:MAG TPA: ABC transporter permease [Acidimicrobiales bacterium]|nr:ABC transporter permease [Acidimicrobiales bacterium]